MFEASHSGRRVLVAAVLVSLAVLVVSIASIGVAMAAVDAAERTIENDTVAPGETTTVTVDVALDDAGEIEVTEQVDPTPGDLAIESDDGATIATASDDEVVSSWGDRKSVTLVYTVSVPVGASDGDTYTIDGTAGDRGDDDSLPISGEDTITVEASDGAGEADRTIATDTLAPGETTEVTVDVAFDDESEIELVEQIDPALADLAIESDDGATVATASNDEVVSSWGGRESVTLVYSATVPTDASDGDTFTIDGTAHDREDEASTAVSGDDTITVEAEAGDGGGGETTPTITPPPTETPETATSTPAETTQTPTPTTAETTQTPTPASDDATQTPASDADGAPSTATIAVNEADSDDETPTPTATPGESGPGFGILVALLAILAVTVRRRW